MHKDKKGPPPLEALRTCSGPHEQTASQPTSPGILQTSSTRRNAF